MKKFFLVVFILLDLTVMAGAAFVLYYRVSGPSKAPAAVTQVLATVPLGGVLKSHATTGSKSPAEGEARQGRPAVSTATPSLITAAPGTGASDNLIRKTFSYRNSKAKKVMIRAEFTGWKAEPMVLDKKKNVWVYTAALNPGEYAYGFTADDKFIHDPANPKTKRIGTITASVIVVKPGPAPAPATAPPKQP